MSFSGHIMPDAQSGNLSLCVGEYRISIAFDTSLRADGIIRRSDIRVFHGSAEDEVTHLIFAESALVITDADALQTAIAYCKAH